MKEEGVEVRRRVQGRKGDGEDGRRREVEER